MCQVSPCIVEIKRKKSTREKISAFLGPTIKGTIRTRTTNKKRCLRQAPFFAWILLSLNLFLFVLVFSFQFITIRIKFYSLG
jgi:hypothetical protein